MVVENDAKAERLEWLVRLTLLCLLIGLLTTIVNQNTSRDDRQLTGETFQVNHSFFYCDFASESSEPTQIPKPH